ncbi:hypothetical protein GCM10023340_02210 [Nocardioides marinquilinus]|uniref:MmcQ/YjbR family DNA-binding protein n=1 Tax=Nocardioides marinquilinus TaxID=1210400 RepID=A0ABP9P5U6_9ACTN
MGRALARIAEAAAPHLEPGEQVHGAFAGQTRVPFRMGDRYRTVVATDRRILVFDSGGLSQTKARELLAVLPRDLRLGPASGLWHRVQLGEHLLHVNRRYFADLAAIDDVR